MILFSEKEGENMKKTLLLLTLTVFTAATVLACGKTEESKETEETEIGSFVNEASDLESETETETESDVEANGDDSGNGGNAAESTAAPDNAVDNGDTGNGEAPTDAPESGHTAETTEEQIIQ